MRCIALKEIKELVGGEKQTASQAVKRLTELMNALDQRNNMLMQFRGTHIRDDYTQNRPTKQYVNAICPERTIFLGIAASHEDRSLEGKLCSPPAGLA